MKWLIPLILLTACQTEEPVQTIRPVRVARVESPEEARIRTFSGTAKASDESVLSFKVDGTVILIAVNVGDVVKRHELLAALDPLDFQLEVERTTAELEKSVAGSRNADANYERVRSLYETRVASRADLDKARADAEAFRAAVIAAEREQALAMRNLDYTDLVAPADGAIAEKIAEVNENVTANQPILKLVSGTRPEVEIQMPEVLIGQLYVDQPITATFAALGGKELQGRVRYIGVATTGASTTYPVTLVIDDPHHEIRSGMTASITFTLPYPPGKEVITIPAVAVGQDQQGRYVYVVRDYDGSFGTVERVSVETGDLLDEEIQILSGLDGGEQVVIAGIRNLRPGMKVRLYKGKSLQ